MTDHQATKTQTAKPPGELLSSLARNHAVKLHRDHLQPLSGHAARFAQALANASMPTAMKAWQDYLVDLAQRWTLFLDTLRQRGNSYIEREREGFKPVLIFDYEVVVDGRKLGRPVNYALVRILPPEGSPPQREDGRPFVVIDPRAGHGSGIGGYKSDSEVGVALQDGHPVYFVIFFPDPEPQQTLADITAAEGLFLEEVHRRHPQAPLPLVIGNCQGGWAAMLLAATHPDLCGPLVIAGAPLSYWAGEIGKNPMRYLGGLVGGVLPVLLLSDITGGRFDGAHLVLNFEHLNPGSNWWRKYYKVFAEVDDEAPRYLEFEHWWSGFYFMNEAEIRWIVENLFIGNRLTRGEAILDDGTPIDLKHIKSPVIVFASHGDNITPPQQALNWIADLYDSVDEIRARGQIIIYTLHESVGHLGIFVSSTVAKKQHKQITSVVKTIEALGPGLYEMVIDSADDDDGKREYHVSFETRQIDDILALDDGREEENEFRPVARLSEWASDTYELTMRPFVKAAMPPQVAESMVNHHPLRQRRYFFSDLNPWLFGLDPLAEQARRERQPAEEDNPFLQLERLSADAVESVWNFYRDVRDAAFEMTFHAIYAQPWMKHLGRQHRQRPKVELSHLPEVRAATARADEGGYAEAVIRMLLMMAHARGSVRRSRLERSNQILHQNEPFSQMSAEARSRIIHEQTLIVEFAPEAAARTLPHLIPDPAERQRAVELVLEVAGPLDEMSPPTIAQMTQLQDLLGVTARAWTEATHVVRPFQPVTGREGGETNTQGDEAKGQEAKGQEAKRQDGEAAE